MLFPANFLASTEKSKSLPEKNYKQHNKPRLAQNYIYSH